MKNKYYASGFGLALLVSLSAVLLNSVIAVQPVRSAESAVADLSAARYLERVTYLARDEMKGRGDGSPELDQAADYIASQFRTFGLKAAGDDPTYFQNFELTTGADFGSKNELQLSGENLRINEDFVPIAFSNTAEFEGPVVFAGYGITAAELHYDDYRGINANAKVVVILRHEPQELDPASPFNGTNFTVHASFINKAINARQHGAKGIVFITDPNNHAADPDTVGEATRIEESTDFGISAVQARRGPVMKLFKDAGRDLAAVQKKIDANLEPQSFELPAVRIRIATEKQCGMSSECCRDRTLRSRMSTSWPEPTTITLAWATAIRWRPPRSAKSITARTTMRQELREHWSWRGWLRKTTKRSSDRSCL